MNPTTPTCFVISPIGDKGSEIRKHADDVFELVIEPALEKFSFSVLRADKITSVESITSDVIDQIQNADLCLIDITGHNPNVMYECGRRHETGKPSIMLAKEGEKLPFDITTIRTIFFNLSSGREIRAAVKAIQDAVGRMVADGFKRESSGESLSSLADAMRRIERTLENVVALRAPSVQSGSPVGPNASQIIKQYGEVAALNYAFSQRNANLVDEILPRFLAKGKNDEDFNVAGLGQGAAIGSRVAYEALAQRMPTFTGYPLDKLKKLVGCFVSGANLLDDEARAIDLVGPIIEEIINDHSGESSPTDRAFFLNQKQRLLHALNRTQEAIAIGDRVLELCPNDVAYLYNQSINRRDAGELPRAVELVDRYMAIVREQPKPDDDHLRHAVRVYAKAREKLKALDAFQLLEKHHPYISELIREDDDVKAVIG